MDSMEFLDGKTDSVRQISGLSSHGPTAPPAWTERVNRRKLHGVTIECVLGDIVQQPGIDAIVNAANAELRSGGGVAGAIHRAAGPDLEAACRPLAPVKPGQAVITDAFLLKNRYVIHCLGPVYGHDEPAEALLASCYRNALHLAEQKKLSSVAFPAISTGAFGYPMILAADISFKVMLQEMPELNHVRLIRFVLPDDLAFDLHSTILLKMAERVGG
jgi:O-acetyl-ADP-ribose deacetylase (regulator of RNase III)